MINIKNDINFEVFWCSVCSVPLIKISKGFFHKCPLCGQTIKYLSKDIRPVFPEERLLFELITGNVNKFVGKSVWCNNSTYFVDGVPYKISSQLWSGVDPDFIRSGINKHKNSEDILFKSHIKRFVEANKVRYLNIRFEAMQFIRDVVSQYENMPKYVSFSGGKDSTVVSDLVVKALKDPGIPHIYCDTTLEYPCTVKYIERFKANNPYIILKTAINREHDFYSVCDDIGVPSRMKRWCCTIFKTGVISKLTKRMFGEHKLLYFNGLRRSESGIRNKYLRVSNAAAQKIQNQISVSPIINWKDIEVWLYILSEGLDFNDAYRLGFPRVGCFCCPNGSLRNEVLSRIYIPDKTKRWFDYLVKFAENTGVDDPNRYVFQGLWKSKNGGSGIKKYSEISLSYNTCTMDENAKIYDVEKKTNDSFYALFTPFGKVCRSLGRKNLDEVIVLRNSVPIISIQHKESSIVKIKTMNVKNHNMLHKQVLYQLTKYKLCRGCYKCEAVCPKRAITVQSDKYIINEDKCVHCLACVNSVYIKDGCMMKRYLRVKADEYDK